MDYKVKSLFDKVYNNFIRGEYGTPKIPTRNQVIKKIEEVTSIEYAPILDNEKLSDIDIKQIRKKFNSIVDDIDVLFSSVEKESSDILDQLTNSLKESNGIKRELRKIKSRTDDILTGKLGEQYLNYSFTETFDDISHINSIRSDPVDINAGIFTIRNNSSKEVTLYHYNGKKLEFNIIEYYARLLDYGYVGTTDAAAMLDPSDDRQLFYKIKTDKPSPIRVAFSLQLTPDSKPLEINGVSLVLDANLSGGNIRVYYRDKTKWKDIPTLSIQPIKSNKVEFKFSNVETTHVKIEFIKDKPDYFTENEYYFIIRQLSIYNGTSKRRAVVYSEPITITSYSNETPIITNVRATIDGDVPKDTSIKLYVAQDIEFSGQFRDSLGDIVTPTSLDKVEFDTTASGTVLLSDLLLADSTISGIEWFQSIDFSWQQISFDTVANILNSDLISTNISKTAEFKNIVNHDSIVNSIYSVLWKYKFGDTDYTGPWPQIGTDWISGWCNSDNPLWETILQPMVESGILNSGINISAELGWPNDSLVQDSSGNINPLVTGHAEWKEQWLGYGSSGPNMGYPWGYVQDDGSVFRFGQAESVVHGWWRPYSFVVTPTGLSPEYATYAGLDSTFVFNTPDFYFNNIGFYKIYKFGNTQTLLEPTIKLYTYEERPITNSGDIYSHIFSWNYKSSWTTKYGAVTSALDYDFDYSKTNFSGYFIDILDLGINEDYLVSSIQYIKIHGTNIILTEGIDYYIKPVNNSLNSGYLDLTPMTTTYPYLNPTGVTFDYNYTYRVKDKYLSTWVGYAIISPSTGTPGIKIFNKKSILGEDIIKEIVIENLDTGIIESISTTTEFELKFDDRNKNDISHYKLTLFCLSDSATSFSARDSNDIAWTPFGNNILIDPNIRLVNKITPLSVVDMATLMYDTPMSNNSRVGIYNDIYDNKFLVVKCPSRDVFPGYYFNTNEKKYYNIVSNRIGNSGHYIREGFLSVDSSGTIIYTTGSSGIYVYNNKTLIDEDHIDKTWNNGRLLQNYPNSTGDINFPVHTTYGYPININTEQAVNSGFLFYNTAENLPTYYSISYSTSNQSNKINSRFLYKLELESNNDRNLVPVVRSVKFNMNV